MPGLCETHGCSVKDRRAAGTPPGEFVFGSASAGSVFHQAFLMCGYFSWFIFGSLSSKSSVRRERALILKLSRCGRQPGEAREGSWSKCKGGWSGWGLVPSFCAALFVLLLWGDAPWKSEGPFLIPVYVKESCGWGTFATWSVKTKDITSCEMWINVIFVSPFSVFKGSPRTGQISTSSACPLLSVSLTLAASWRSVFMETNRLWVPSGDRHGKAIRDAHVLILF